MWPSVKASLKTVVLNTCQLACLQKSYTLAHGLFCPQSHDQGNEIGNNHQSYCQHIVMSDVEAQNVTKAKTKQMMQNDTDCKGVFVFVFWGVFFWGGGLCVPLNPFVLPVLLQNWLFIQIFLSVSHLSHH